MALCVLIALLISHILTPAEALSGFSNSVVIMMAGLFIVGGAIFQTGLAKMISSRLLRLAGNSETRLFLLVMLGTSAIGAFVSNTGTVALMLPIVVSMAANAGVSSGRLLMPLAFASLLPLTKVFLSGKGKKDDKSAAGKSLNQLVKEYGLSHNLFRLKAVPGSGAIGKTVVDLDLRNRYGLNLLEVRRGEGSQHRFLKTLFRHGVSGRGRALCLRRA